MTNNSSSPIRSDTDDYEINSRCPTPVQPKNETSLFESSDPVKDVTIDSTDFLGVNQNCDKGGNDFLNSNEDCEDEAETDISCANNSQNCSVVATPCVATMSTSLDLLKAYDFSDDDEESDEIVETTKISPEIVAPSTTQLSDDSEPEECSSKISIPVENVVSDEKIVANESVGTEGTDTKKSRKRKRQKDSTENYEESKSEKETDKRKPDVPDLMNHHKRNRRPTLLEKVC